MSLRRPNDVFLTSDFGWATSFLHKFLLIAYEEFFLLTLILIDFHSFMTD